MTQEELDALPQRLTLRRYNCGAVACALVPLPDVCPLHGVSCDDDADAIVQHWYVGEQTGRLDSTIVLPSGDPSTPADPPAEEPFWSLRAFAQFTGRVLFLIAIGEAYVRLRSTWRERRLHRQS